MVNNLGSTTHRFAMRSDRIMLSLATRLRVRKYFWYEGSNSHQGAVIEKNSSSWARASLHEMPCLSDEELGCFTQNQLLVRGSLIFLINEIQFSSSPVEMRSGLVSTPGMHRQNKYVQSGNQGLRTNCTCALGIMLLGQLMCSLILEIG